MYEVQSKVIEKLGEFDFEIIKSNMNGVSILVSLFNEMSV